MRCMTRRLEIWGLGCSALAWLGCGGAGDPSPEPSADPSTSGLTAASGSSTSTSSTSTTTDDPHRTTAVDSTGVIFVPETDGGGTSYECDPFAQDCRPGEKCTLWANDGGYWNATKCVPVVDDPGGIDEPCHMEGSPTSGIDDCNAESMCFYVDPETLEGICTPFCQGRERDPQCDPDRFCHLQADGALVLCLPRCNPLAQDCGPGQSCYIITNHWGCGPDGSDGAGAFGDPCETVNGCAPGLVCLDSAAVPPGYPCEGALGCCTNLCDTTDPLGDQQCMAEGQTCQPWYEEGNAPAGLEHLGACALPW